MPKLTNSGLANKALSADAKGRTAEVQRWVGKDALVLEIGGDMTTPIVFISYSHHDKISTFAIDQWLRNKGIRVLIDDRDFVPGVDIEDEIVRCIRQSGKIVCIYSKHSADRPYVKLERRIASTIETDDKKSSRRLIYFCIDETPLPVEARPRLAIMAAELNFKDACSKLGRAVLEVASEPLEVDLTQYEEKPPWVSMEENRNFADQPRKLRNFSPRLRRV